MIDDLIEKDAQILISGSRMNAYHSPRIVFMKVNEIHDKFRPTYLFVHGENQTLENNKYNLGKLIYENDFSNQYCYRSPNLKCTKNKIKLFRIFLD